MKRETKDISLSDFDLNLDMEIEMENKAGKTGKIGNTLDYYNDEMSRKEVERLIAGRSAEKPPEPELAPKHVLDGGPKTESENIDYAYMVNLLSEMQRDEGDKREKETMTKMASKKTQLIRAYKTMRVALIAVVVVFMAVLALLISNLQKTKKDLETVTASKVLLEKEYSTLDIQKGGLETKITEHEQTIKNLEDTIDELIASSQPVTTPTPNNGGGEMSPSTGTGTGTGTATGAGTATGTGTATGSGTSQTTLPTTYLVKNGDSLWGISLAFYKDGNLYKEIMKANNMSSEKDLKSGVYITIPKV